MMPIPPKPEPPEFNDTVRVPGLRSVCEKSAQPVPACLTRTNGKPFPQVKRKKLDASGKSVKDAHGQPVLIPVTRPEDIPVVPGEVALRDPAIKARVEETIQKLKLNDVAFARDRRRDIEDFEQREIGMRRLREESPFVAAELERQGRLPLVAGSP